MMLRIALISMAACLLFAGLAPFEFSIDNRAHWAIPGPGVQIEAPGALYSARGIETDGGAMPAALTFHLWIEAEERVGSRIATLLALVDGDEPAALTFGQWSDTFLVRIRGSSADSHGYREVRAPGGLLIGQETLVSVRIDPLRGTTIFTGSAENPQTFSRSEVLPTAPFSGRLLLGCRQDGGGFWRGRYLGLVVQDGALSNEEIREQRVRLSRESFTSPVRAHGVRAHYRFAAGHGESVHNFAVSGALGPLQIPTRFVPLAPPFLLVPRLEALLTPWFAADLLLNLLGFIPLGVLTAWWLREREGIQRTRILLVSLLLGACISLVIEVVQYWIPFRQSTLLDLAMNSLGALSGAALGLLRRR